jgi:hypothetical protein
MTAKKSDTIATGRYAYRAVDDRLSTAAFSIF